MDNAERKYFERIQDIFAKETRRH